MNENMSEKKRKEKDSNRSKKGSKNQKADKIKITISS